MEKILTACPRNCYSTCSFYIWKKDKRLVKIEPDRNNPAVPEGPCLKGLSYLERVYSSDRILHPMKRTANGFKRISWDEAIGIIVDKLSFFKNNYGARSILYYHSSGMSGLLNQSSMDFWKMFGGATIVYGNLCWPAGLEATNLTLGENKHNVPWDLENASLIVFWGKNPAETNIQQMIPVEKAQKAGAKLILIDPRRTPSSERADMLVQPVSGTDGLLALGIAKLIIEEGKHDTEFIAKHVHGFDQFRKSLDDIELDRVSEICRVSEETIRNLARLFSSVKPMSIIAGFGMQRYSNGGQTIRCLLSLPVITGNIGLRGGGWQYANLQSYVFDSVKEPDSYYPDPLGEDVFRRSISTTKLGEDMLNQKDPILKMAWVERGNPLAQNPDSKRVHDAFSALDFRVVVEQFMTDTAREADIILPAKSMFEQSDIIGSYWNPFVSLRQKIIDPPGEVKPETEIYRLLAQKLGFDREETDSKIPSGKDNGIEKWLGERLIGFPELSFDKLKKGPLMAPGLQEIAFRDLKFKTPSGKIELFSEEASRKWGVDPLPKYVPPEIDNHYPLALISPNTKNRIHSQFGNLSVIKMLDPVPYVTMCPTDANPRNIREGEKVRVFNSNGELFFPVKIDNSLKPGHVVIFNGYWNEKEGSPNMLSKAKETDMGFGSSFHCTRVQVEKIN